jgi:hypothetical protein
MKPLEVIKTCPNYKHWMEHWIAYDPETEEYIGYTPDEEESCRETSPSDFLLKFLAAAIEWGEHNE